MAEEDEVVNITQQDKDTMAAMEKQAGLAKDAAYACPTHQVSHEQVHGTSHTLFHEPLAAFEFLVSVP